MPTIERADAPDENLLAALNHLLPQLDPSVTPLTLAELSELLEQPGVHVLVAREESHMPVRGMLVLATFRAPTGKKAWIEDLVVDDAARQAGIGTALAREAVRLAGVLGCPTVDLTSRPSRGAANRLYTRLGMQRRDTNVYRTLTSRDR